MKLRTPLLGRIALLAVLLAALTLAPAASAQTTTVVPYVVQPGDTLGKIASKYCTTWEEVYQLNAGVIGPNPDILYPGTLLYVPNRCTTSSSGVYDHGPSMYANGTVTGNVYTVAAGDTWYSIGVRFGLPWETISAANGGGGLYPGRQLIIPGLSSTPPPAQSTYITITNPQPGAMLPSTFTVSGKGAGSARGQRRRDGEGQRRPGTGPEGDHAARRERRHGRRGDLVDQLDRQRARHHARRHQCHLARACRR